MLLAALDLDLKSFINEVIMLILQRVRVNLRQDGKYSISMQGLNDAHQSVQANVDEVSKADIAAVVNACVTGLIKTQSTLWAVKTDSRDTLQSLGLWPIKA